MCTTGTRQYRKPDGTITRDHQEYAAAWSKLADEVQAMFPGYLVNGMDPGLTFVPDTKGRYDSFSLPLGACKALLESRGNK